MRHIWTLCGLMLSLTVSVSTAAAVTKASPSHRLHWIRVTHHGTQAKYKRASRSTGAAAAAIAGALAGEDPMLFGDQNVESGVDSISAGRADAFPFIETTSGSAQWITIYLDSRNHAGRLVAGIYSDSNGQPGTLLVSGTNSSLTSGAWNTVTIASTSVSSGNKYWVTLLGRSGTLYFRDVSSGTCRSAKSAQTSLSALPSQWNTGRTFATCPASAYVGGTPESSLSSTSGSPSLLGPSNTAPPTVTGTTTTGQTLTTTNGSWTNLPTSYAYAWQDCDSSGNNCNTISGATSSSHTLASGDAGHTIRSVVTASNVLGSATAASDPTSVVVPPVPSNTVPPAVSGIPTQGQTLTTGNGSWTNSPTSFKYAWQDCDGSGNNCTSVSGATSSTYMLASGDVGHTIRSIATAANAGGSTSASSTPTAPVAPPAPTASFTFSPASPVTGQAVTFDATASTCAAAPCTYTWADDPPSGGSWALGTGQTVSFTFQVVGTKYVTLTMTDAQNRTATVELDVAVASSAPSAPTNTTAPHVSGTAQQGSTLNTTTGSWSNSPTSYAYAWRECDTSGSGCVPISGATSSSYTLAAGDVGHTIRAVVTATNTAGGSSATSSQTAVVAAAPIVTAPANTALPTITGTTTQGQTLTTSNGLWTGSPSSYAYQWQDCNSSGASCTNISGATSSSYTLAAGDGGHEMRAVVTATNAGGSTPATANPTAAVGASTSPGGGSGGLVCTQHITTSTFASAFSAAGAGAVLCLSPGNYGNFAGAAKPAPGVAITSDQSAGGTQANVIFAAANLGGSTNIRLDTVTLGQSGNTAVSIQSNPTNVAVTNSAFKGAVEIDNIQSSNHQNVLFNDDDFAHTGLDCSDLGNNAVFALHYSGAGHSGVTVENSAFGNTDCDGIHTGTGLDVLNNTFTNICEDSGSDPQHTDNIQTEGMIGGRIAGNYVHEEITNCITQGITSYDGNTNGVLIEDNVVDIGRPWGIEWYGDINSTIRHNTVVYRASGCEYGDQCGWISIDCRSSEFSCGNNAAYGTQVYDNIAKVTVDDGAKTARNDHNYNGPDVTFRGGSSPPPDSGFASFSDYLLASGSAGKGAADDGSDLGITG